MGTKAFFDGNVLTVVELPDRPLPSVLGATPGENFTPANPLGLDPATLRVDAAQLDNLRPTDGALPPTKFPERLPGKGEGAGVGQPSGSAFRDVWENNPNRELGLVDTVQSGEVGSALPPRVQTAAEVTAAKLADAWTADKPAAVAKQRAEAAQAGGPAVEPVPAKSEYDLAAEGWNNKDAIRASISTWGGEDPHAAATREELEEAAREAWDAKQLA